MSELSASNEGKQRTTPSDYSQVLSDLSALIRESRRRAATSANRELLVMYLRIGTTILERQARAEWGNRVVARLADDLRSAFPDLRGLTKDNLFRMQKFVLSCREMQEWLAPKRSQVIENKEDASILKKVGTLSGQSRTGGKAKVGTPCPLSFSPDFMETVCAISWSHHRLITSNCESAEERYFYTRMAAAERWSVRELRRQIDSVLYTRYVTVKDSPEQCLPDHPEAGDLLPFRDHYVLDFLGLQEEHSERQLQKAILDNLRDFFLEFGRDLSFVGEEYPLTVGNDTYSIDLLFFHRRLQCLIAVELKRGKFKPEYAGKSRFYCAALDEQIRLEHERPSLGLVLCRSADSVQVRLALTDAADRIGVATYQTGLPDSALIERRLAQFRLCQFPSAENDNTTEEHS
ncbi:MAG: PDDEXK nuclease domain-containing protein [Fuerstiella sp.]